MDHHDDPHALDPSVEDFIARAKRGRYAGAEAKADIAIHGTPRWATFRDLSDSGHPVASLTLEYGYGQQMTNYMPVPVARALALAINRVLMAHERPARERVRDIEVTAADGEVF